MVSWFRNIDGTKLNDYHFYSSSYERYKTSEGKTRYATVGYTTIYLYYAYPENIRPRISQMLVLPPFQRLGIGSKFIQVSTNLHPSHYINT